MNLPPTNKSRLVNLDNTRHERGEAQGKPFGDQLPHQVDEVDRPVVPESIRRRCFVEEHHHRAVDVVETSEVELPEGLENPNDVRADNALGGLVKGPGETIGAGRPVRRGLPGDARDLIGGERDHEVLQVKLREIELRQVDAVLAHERIAEKAVVV